MQILGRGIINSNAPMCFNVSCTVVDLVFHKSFECESYGLTTEFHSKFISVRMRCKLFSLQRFCQNYVDSIVGLLDMLSMLMCGMSSSRCDVRSERMSFGTSC